MKRIIHFRSNAFHSFDKHLLGASYVPGTVLGTGNKLVNETTKILAHMELASIKDEK